MIFHKNWPGFPRFFLSNFNSFPKFEQGFLEFFEISKMASLRISSKFDGVMRVNLKFAYKRLYDQKEGNLAYGKARNSELFDVNLRVIVLPAFLIAKLLLSQKSFHVVRRGSVRFHVDFCHMPINVALIESHQRLERVPHFLGLQLKEG